MAKTTATATAPKKTKEVQLIEGMEEYLFDPSQLTIVGAKHPLANKLYLSRNDNTYKADSPEVKSFVAEGQLQAVGLFPYINEETGKKELVVAFGNQRVRKAEAGGIKVRGVVFEDWSADDAEKAAGIENAQRQDLSVRDLLIAVVRRIAFHKEAGTTNVYGTVNAEFGKSEVKIGQWARDMESVALLPSRILKAVTAGTFGMTHAIKVAREKGKTPEETKELQLALFDKLRAEAGDVSTGKGGKVKVKDVESHRVTGEKKEVLSAKEWRYIAANPKLLRDLEASEVADLIRSVLGDISIDESQRADLEFVKHIDPELLKTESKNGKKNGKSELTKAAAQKTKATAIENLTWNEDEDDDEDEDDE